MAQTNFFEEESVSKRLINTSVGVLVDFHYSLLAFQHSAKQLSKSERIAKFAQFKAMKRDKTRVSSLQASPSPEPTVSSLQASPSPEPREAIDSFDMFENTGPTPRKVARKLHRQRIA